MGFHTIMASPEGHVVKSSVEDYANLLKGYYRNFNLESPAELGSGLRKLPHNSFEFILKSQLITGFEVSVYIDGKNEWYSNCMLYILQHGLAYSLIDKEARVSVVIPYSSIVAVTTEVVRMVVPSGFCIRTKQKSDGHWFSSLKSRHNIVNFVEYFCRCARYSPGADSIKSVDVRRVKESTEKLTESLRSCHDASDYERTARLLAETCELASASLQQLSEQGEQLQRVKEGSDALKTKLSSADKLIKSLDSWGFSSGFGTSGGISSDEKAKIPRQLEDFNFPVAEQDYLRIFPVLHYENTTYRPRLLGVTMDKLVVVVDSSSCTGGIGEVAASLVADLSYKCVLEVEIKDIFEINTGPAPFYMNLKFAKCSGIFSGMFGKDEETVVVKDHDGKELRKEPKCIDLVSFSQIDLLQILHSTHSYITKIPKACERISIFHHGYDRYMNQMQGSSAKQEASGEASGLAALQSSNHSSKHVTQQWERKGSPPPSEEFEFRQKDSEALKKQMERNYDPNVPKNRVDIDHAGSSTVQTRIEADHECLDKMVEMLGPLKDMASQITTELDVQNQLLDDVNDSVDDVSEKMKNTNRRIDKVLKG